MDKRKIEKMDKRIIGQMDKNIVWIDEDMIY